MIFILTLITTFCLFFFFYFLCNKLFVCLKPKKQNIMRSSNILEAKQATKVVCLTADDRFRRLAIRNVLVWQWVMNKMILLLSKCSKYNLLPRGAFFVCMWSCAQQPGEQQAILALKELCNWSHLLSSASQNLTRWAWGGFMNCYDSLQLFKDLLPQKAEMEKRSINYRITEQAPVRETQNH